MKNKRKLIHLFIRTEEEGVKTNKQGDREKGFENTQMVTNQELYCSLEIHINER